MIYITSYTKIRYATTQYTAIHDINISYNMIWYNAIQYDPIYCDMIWYNMILYDMIPNTIIWNDIKHLHSWSPYESSLTTCQVSLGLVGLLVSWDASTSLGVQLREALLTNESAVPWIMMAYDWPLDGDSLL